MRFIRDFIHNAASKATETLSWAMSRCTSVVVRVMVVVLVLLVSFWLSLFLHLILVQILVPTKSFSWPAYLDLEPDLHHLGGGNLTAVVPLSDSPASDTHCILPPMPRDGRKKQAREGTMPTCSGEPLAGPALLKRGQRYSVAVELVLPDSRPNRHHPMFHAQVTMLDGRYNEISASRRPLLVPYRSKLQRVASTLLQLPYLLVMDSFPETHTVKTAVYDHYLDDPQRPARFVRLQLLRSGGLHVLSAHLHVQASFSGLQHILDQHPLLCAAVGTLVNMTLVLAACTVVYFKRVENLEQQRRQRKLAKAARQASGSEFTLRNGKESSSGDRADVGPLCDIDGELRLQKQKENATNEKLSESKARREKRSSSLKKTDSFRQKKGSSAMKAERSCSEEKICSAEERNAHDGRKVSFPDEGTNSLHEKKNLTDAESVLEEKNSSVAGKPRSSHDGEHRSEYGSREYNLTCGNGCCTDDKTASYSLELGKDLDAHTCVRKRPTDSGEKSSVDSEPLKVSVRFEGSDEEGSSEVSAGQTGPKASLLAEGALISSPSITLESSVPTSTTKEDASVVSAVAEVDLVSSPTNITDVECTVSPPASPVSTTSSGSQTSLGDFTMLN